MFSYPWFVVVLVSIPEAFLIISLGFALYNFNVPPVRAIAMATISALCTYFIRCLPLMWGIHTIMAVIILTILAVLILKTNLLGSLVAVLTGVVLLLVIQSLLAPGFFAVTNTTLTDMANDPWLNVWFFIPQGIILILIYYFVTTKDYYIYKVNWN